MMLHQDLPQVVMEAMYTFWTACHKCNVADNFRCKLWTFRSFIGWQSLVMANSMDQLITVAVSAPEQHPQMPWLRGMHRRMMAASDGWDPNRE